MIEPKAPEDIEVELPPYDIQPGEWELTCRERQLKAEIAAKNELQKELDGLAWVRGKQKVIDSYAEETKFYHDAAVKAEKERDEWLRLYTDSVIDRAELMEKAGLI